MKEVEKTWKPNVLEYIEEHPKRCVLVAGISGLVLGIVISCLVCRR